MGGRRVGLRPIDKRHVDKQEVLNKYLKNNLLKLTSPSTTKNVEKSLRKKFYEENKLPASSRFTGRDVAEEIVDYILKTRSFGWEEFVQEVKKVPFLMEELPNDRVRLLYQEHATDSSLFFNPSDLSKLSQEEYLRRIEEEFKAKASQRAEEEISAQREEIQKLKEELERKEGDLKKFESELNKLPKDLSIENIEKQVEKEVSEDGQDFESNWWKRLEMPSNPLETYDGLYGIAQDRFEEVVVKTSMVNQYLGEIRDDPESFSGKTMMVIGDYGTGKTTLFEYLSAQAVSLDVVPILIVLNPGPSVASLMNIFLQELRNQLMETNKSIHKVDLRSNGMTSNPYGDCLEVFRDLNLEVSHGFLIFIDGLHKTKAYLPQVFEFLQQIQNTLTYFTRHKVKLGFIVAGSPYWKFELENNPSMSGSYYRIDEIPVLTEEDATDAIKRRMNLYQTEVSQAITIDEGSLRKSFQVLSERLSNPVTFRDFISHVRRRLELNKFEEVGLSVKIHIETVDAVKASMRRSHLYNQYKSLLFDISESRSLRKALQRVISDMIKYRGIPESSTIFEKNKGAFYMLKKHDLIVQHKTTGSDEFKWHLSDDMISTTIGISQHLKLEPSKILRAMLEEETLAQEEETNSIYSMSINTIRGLISSWKESIPEVAELLSNCKKGIEGISSRVSETKYMRSSDLKYTLMQIIKSINVIMRSSTPIDSDDLNDFLESWAAPDNIDEIRDFCEEKIQIRSETAKVYGLLHNHNKLISQLLDILSDQVKGEALSRLNGRKLTVSQFLTIHQLRTKFQIQAYEDVVDGACTLIERSIREVIYPSMRVIWGKDAINKVPFDILQKLKTLPERGHPRTKRPSDPNFLYDISRSEYTKILFKREIYNAIFGNRLSEAEKTKFKGILELSSSLDDRLAHRDRKSYFRMHATEIVDVLKNLPWFLEKLGNVCVFFLTTCRVDLKKTSDTELRSRFRVDPVASEEFVIEKRVLDNFSKTFLETLSFKEIVMDNPETMFLTTELDPEFSFSAFRALLVEEFIEYREASVLPGIVRITQKGRELLSSYLSKSNGIIQP
ncbi:MAG: AAA family ATPase [Thermoplasmataceae archaeon]